VNVRRLSDGHRRYGSAVAATEKRFEYEVRVGRSGEVEARDVAARVPAEWSAEHLVLAGLVRCSIASLRYHARRTDVDVEAGGSASCVIAKREDDGRFGIVQIAVDIDAELDPEPDGQAIAELLAKAERDCFVGASLRLGPQYRWTVAGRERRAVPTG
jgi:organic hydroperoxide reductase OsmC/OhrA